MLRRRLQMAGNGGNIPEWRHHLQPCEYIETDGNCWIDFPFNCNNITNINNFEGKGGVFFGLRKSSGRFFQLTNNGEFYYFRYFCTGSEILLSNVQSTNWLKFSYNSSTKVCFFNDETITNTYEVVKNINLNIILFRGFINGTYSNALNGTQIFNFETNLFNLLSVYVIDEYIDNKTNLCSSGIAGMVDTLTGVFYTNDGTGNFAHGADIIL